MSAGSKEVILAAAKRTAMARGYNGLNFRDIAAEVGIKAPSIYHHFPTKTALFEAPFMQAHTDLMTASTKAAPGASDGIDELARGFEAFLDGVLQPDMQRILIVDGPAVLGLARYTELDEQYAHAVIVHSLTAAAEAGTITVEDPETATRLLLGALTRGAMLIANSPDPVETRHAVGKSMRALLTSFTPSRG